ncbi:quorum-sensing phosphorelay protein LuxU [Vibrio taketomensis]|uniref:quorum-sensing phosphorelay protein LuxU n=1 Tax=Vibrio taketomensis TaxID=2572923 RepID=UPI00138963BC|nr:quorum-sensing phosphorelay protein LuxU [Vibrio taketomensis]
MNIINQQQIDRLRQEIGDDNLPILLDIFLGELNQYTQKLNQAEVDQDAYLKEISHALKSSAASFGAEALRALAVDYDGAGKAGLFLDSSVHKEQMLSLLSQTQQQYAELLSKH